MEKGLKWIFAAAALTVAVSSLVVPAKQVFAEEQAGYNVAMTEDENLAENKWDWATDKVGAADTYFTAGKGFTVQDFNRGGGAFGVYKTNRLNEFKYSMYANLSLTYPSAKGFSGYDFDYSNFYLSFLIDADPVVPSNSCPWNGNAAYVCLSFEERYDKDSQTENDITSFYVNECWNRHGDQRAIVKDVRDVDFNDGKFHWYELEVRNFEETKSMPNGSSVTSTGKRIKFFFDGEEKMSYDLVDGNRATVSAGGEKRPVNFTALDGYLGYWTDTDFPVGALKEKTDCYVEVQKVKIVDLSTGESFKKCAAPEFEIEELDWSPSEYEVGDEIELKLSKLFAYEGDETLTYEITCNGEPIGEIRNGFWVYTPDKAGEFDIDFKAIAGSKSKIAYRTLRVSQGAQPPADDSGKDSKDDGSQTSATGGCKGSLALNFAFLPLIIAAGAVAKKSKK